MSSIKLEVFSGGQDSGYLGWSPVPLTVTGDRESGSSAIILSSRSKPGSVSRVVFAENADAEPVPELTVDLEESRQKRILVAGMIQFGQKHNGASEDGKDVIIEAAWADQPDRVEGTLEVMVRVRRNANELSDKARDDFIAALAQLNGIRAVPGPGKGIYVTDFVGMHVAGASDTEHGDSMFLPWHRLYLLDLERLLQRVNPAVTLPYWRFDEPAPNLFSEDFIGATEQIPARSPFTPGTSDKLARFSQSNPLQRWRIGTVSGIPRASFFDTRTEPASGLPAAPPDRPNAFPVINQDETLRLGGVGENAEFGQLRSGFSAMEGTPHGAAHVSFNGYINFVPVAPQDPLFFLLHSNVDRLWALWQFLFDRSLPTNRRSYPYQNRFEVLFSQSGALSGNFADYWKLVEALQWPWDNTQSKPYNLRPPGTRSANFSQSPSGKPIEANIPSITDAIDAFGQDETTNYLGFSYDDVPFDFEPTPAPST